MMVSGAGERFIKARAKNLSTRLIDGIQPGGDGRRVQQGLFDQSSNAARQSVLEVVAFRSHTCQQSANQVTGASRKTP